MTPPIAPSDPPRQHLELDGLRLAFTDEGQGPTVIAIHGLPGSVRDWRWLAGALGGRVRLLRLDMPGFGESDAALAPPEVEAQAALVLRVAGRLGLSRPVLLAHSFGGAVAVAAAAQGGVGALALLAAVGLWPHRSFRAMGAPSLLAAATRTPGLSHLVGPALRLAMVRGGFPRSTTVADAVRSVQGVGDFRFEAHRARLLALRCPTLVAWTEDDPMVEGGISAELAGACPPGPRLRFPEGGHNLQKTQAGPLAEALVAFAAGCG